MRDIFGNPLSIGDRVAYPMVVRRRYEMRTGIIKDVADSYLLIESDKTHAVVSRSPSEVSKDTTC